MRKQHACIILSGRAVFRVLSIDQHTELFLRKIRTARRRKVAWLKAQQDFVRHKLARSDNFKHGLRIARLGMRGISGAPRQLKRHPVPPAWLT
jgi:hypothetical protein